MSAFEATAEKEGQPSENYLLSLVGEGKKYADVEALAKGAFHANQHITNVEQQNKELSEDLTKEDYAKEILAQLKEKAVETVTTPPTVDTDGTKAGDTNPSWSEGDLKSLVMEAVGESKQQDITQGNVKTVDDKLTQMYGTEAKTKVEAKAKELGVGVEMMKSVASTSPAAFFQLMGETPKAEVDTLVTTELNINDAFTAPGKRNNAYYQDLRRTKPKVYHSVKVQQQMHKDASEQGDGYFS